MKKILAAGALALALGGCVAVPVDQSGYYTPAYGYYDPYPYPYYGYGFGYAPYYWGPPVIVAGGFFYRGHHGSGRHWGDGGRHWGDGGHARYGGRGWGGRGNEAGSGRGGGRGR